jgi:hypothetical protein
MNGLRWALSRNLVRGSTMALPPKRKLAWTPASLAFPRRTATELYAEIREVK